MIMKKITVYALCVMIVINMCACSKSTNVNNDSCQISQKDSNENEPTAWYETESSVIVPDETEPDVEYHTEYGTDYYTKSDTEYKTLPETPYETQSQQFQETITQNQDETEGIIGQSPIKPAMYQRMLGKGMDVDWCKTEQGKQYYNSKAVSDFKNAGVNHVRIRIKDSADENLFDVLDRVIDDCISEDIIPIIAYQADEFKNEPTQENINNVVSWWDTVAKRYKDKSFLLSFDLLIEATDAVNSQPDTLNNIYEQLVTAIRQSNPERIIMISPRLRSDAAYLSELAIPTQHNGYLMAEWHFYASGPSKENEKKLWTTGTDAEKKLITDKINLALEWQKDTGIPTWVGAWMPGNYNNGNDYSVDEQVVFAKFMSESLDKAGIPFAVNSDTKFYDRQTCLWIEEMQPVFRAIYG